jgi:prophage DNA circulation protein
MASWRDKFVEGTFRKVPFFTESHTFSSGRRRQDNQFASLEESNSEDLGRRQRKFSLEVYVLGDDYFASRDRLIEALEKSGPGELVHPYLGKKFVQAGSFTLRETVQEGRIATFSIEFAETTKPKFPEASVGALDGVFTSAGLVKDNARSAFEEAFSIANQAAFVLTEATKTVKAYTKKLIDSTKKFTEPIANISKAVIELNDAIDTLIKTPGDLAFEMQVLFDSLLSELEEIPDKAEAIFNDFAVAPVVLDPVLGTTPSKIRISDNNTAITNLVEQVVFANQSQAAVLREYSSSAQGVKIRDQVIENLDKQSESDGITGQVGVSDEVYQGLKDLQAQLLQVLPPDTVGEVITYTPPKTLPALVIASLLFRDLDKEQVIIDQNGIEHPGFVFGSVEIEVPA